MPDVLIKGTANWGDVIRKNAPVLLPMVMLGVYTDLSIAPVLVTNDEEEAVNRAEEEFAKSHEMTWVLNPARDIYAYVCETGTERF